jgi:hypothetical protein
MSGSVRSSAGLIWHHQRLVWWIFAVNLLVAWLSSLSVRATLHPVLDRSLESAKLVTGFDFGTLVLLLERPDVSPRALAPSAIGATLLFVIYLLFIDGGVFAEFLDDRKLSRPEFFENAGLFFWRMVRLALYSLVPFALLAAADGSVAGYARKLSSNAPQYWLGFAVNVGSKLVIVAAALFVRLWFDLAQAWVVRDNEQRVLGTLGRSLTLTFRSGWLYASYIGIALFAAAISGIGAGIWFYLPHSATGASFLILEMITITQIAARLWLKAASARWVALLPGEMAFPSLPLPVQETQAPLAGVTDVRAPLPDPPMSE